jgi:hypothetical protein
MVQMHMHHINRGGLGGETGMLAGHDQFSADIGQGGGGERQGDARHNQELLHLGIL